MDKLSSYEKKVARLLNVSSNDLHKTGFNSYGTVYSLYNNYYLTEMTFSDGYSKLEIYRRLLRKLFKQLNIKVA